MSSLPCSYLLPRTRELLGSCSFLFWFLLFSYCSRSLNAKQPQDFLVVLFPALFSAVPIFHNAHCNPYEMKLKGITVLLYPTQCYMCLPEFSTLKHIQMLILNMIHLNLAIEPYKVTNSFVQCYGHAHSPPLSRCKTSKLEYGSNFLKRQETRFQSAVYESQRVTYKDV